MKKPRILAIINPISGTRSKASVEKWLHLQFPAGDFDFEIKYTRAPNHATDLAKEATDNQTDTVVAVGGDGTVNETAAGLLHTETALGIVPVGSGNGLGRHLKIPSQTEAAIKMLAHSRPLKIDACTANGKPFFNVAGLGYDAAVAQGFAEGKRRGFLGYAHIAIKQWFHFRMPKFDLHYDDKSLRTKALLISVANGSQFGNNAWIAPDAKLDDGKMDICVLRKFPHISVPLTAWQLFTKTIANSRYAKHFRTSEITIKQKGEMGQLDGEPMKLGTKIHFKVLPKALNILAPKIFMDEK